MLLRATYITLGIALALGAFGLLFAAGALLLTIGDAAEHLLGIPGWIIPPAIIAVGAGVFLGNHAFNDNKPAE